MSKTNLPQESVQKRISFHVRMIPTFGNTATKRTLQNANPLLEDSFLYTLYHFFFRIHYQFQLVKILQLALQFLQLSLIYKQKPFWVKQTNTVE